MVRQRLRAFRLHIAVNMCNVLVEPHLTCTGQSDGGTMPLMSHFMVLVGLEMLPWCI